MTYLVAKYAPNSTLYPKEANARAKVDQLLYFDIGTLYRTEGQYLVSYYMRLSEGISCNILSPKSRNLFCPEDANANWKATR